LRYAGRPHSASPAVGYFTRHLEEQQALVNEAIMPTTESIEMESDS